MANILVCDDDKAIVEAIEIYLTQEGYHILKAYDGQEALDILNTQAIDLLIIDIMMPRLDGIRATVKIRESNPLPIIILPNNSNIIMAANSAAELSETPCAVVPTKSVPQAFSALFAVDVDASLETNVEEMTEAAQAVKTGEVTWATRDSKDAEGNPIAEGDVIGIADGSIEAVDDSIDGAVLTLLGKMDAEDADTCTILAGEGYSDEDLEALVAKIEEAYDELEVDAQRGEQPLYPIVFSVE